MLTARPGGSPEQDSAAVARGGSGAPQRRADGAPREVVPGRAKRPLAFPAAVAAAALALIAVTLTVLMWDRGTICPNVFVANMPVGGLSRAKAHRLLARARVPGPDTPVRVRVGDAAERYSLGDIGISFDVRRAVDAAYEVGRTGTWRHRLRERRSARRGRTDIMVFVQQDDRCQRFIEGCARRFDRPPVDAAVEVNGCQVSIKAGVPGMKIDAGESRRAIDWWAARSCRGDLRLPVHFTGPAVTAQRLRGVDTVLSSVGTTLAGSSLDRRHNIALAAKAIDGLILSPGAVFSYNRVVGPRTQEMGYRKAPIIYAGRLVPGTGGGACQLSSTLYQAALLAGLEMIARSHHSHPVPYTHAGLDATVVYDVLDLKFRNTLARPVVLQARISDRRLICRALGHGPAPQIELVRKVTWVEPPPAQLVEDAALAPGERVVEVEPRRGLRVRVTRRRPMGAGGEAELVSTDYYSYRRGVIRQGPALAAAESSPEQVATPPAASGGEAPDGSAPATPTGVEEVKKERATMLTSVAD